MLEERDESPLPSKLLSKSFIFAILLSIDWLFELNLNGLCDERIRERVFQFIDKAGTVNMKSKETA